MPRPKPNKNRTARNTSMPARAPARPVASPSRHEPGGSQRCWPGATTAHWAPDFRAASLRPAAFLAGGSGAAVLRAAGLGAGARCAAELGGERIRTASFPGLASAVPPMAAAPC